MVDNLVNDFQTTLAAAIDSSQTTITVEDAGPVDGQFRIRIGDEWMLVTAGGGGTTWTVTRGIEGSTAAAHDSGTPVFVVWTAGTLQEHLDTKVGLTGNQTIAGSKTFTGTVVTGTFTSRNEANDCRVVISGGTGSINAIRSVAIADSSPRRLRFRIGETTNVMTLETNGRVVVNTDTDATSNQDNALTVVGGIWVAKSAVVEGIASVRRLDADMLELRRTGIGPNANVWRVSVDEVGSAPARSLLIRSVDHDAMVGVRGVDGTVRAGFHTGTGEGFVAGDFVVGGDLVVGGDIAGLGTAAALNTGTSEGNIAVLAAGGVFANARISQASVTQHAVGLTGNQTVNGVKRFVDNLAVGADSAPVAKLHVFAMPDANGSYVSANAGVFFRGSSHEFRFFVDETNQRAAVQAAQSGVTADRVLALNPDNGHVSVCGAGTRSGVVGAFAPDSGRRWDVRGNSYGHVLSTGVQSDTSTGNVDAAPADRGMLRFTGAGTVTLRGIAAPTGTNAQLLSCINLTGNNLTINDNDSAASAANRIRTGTGANVTLPDNRCATLQYDPTSTRWRLLSVSP